MVVFRYLTSTQCLFLSIKNQNNSGNACINDSAYRRQVSTFRIGGWGSCSAPEMGLSCGLSGHPARPEIWWEPSLPQRDSADSSPFWNMILHFKSPIIYPSRAIRSIFLIQIKFTFYFSQIPPNDCTPKYFKPTEYALMIPLKTILTYSSVSNKSRTFLNHPSIAISEWRTFSFGSNSSKTICMHRISSI